MTESRKNPTRGVGQAFNNLRAVSRANQGKTLLPHTEKVTLIDARSYGQDCQGLQNRAPVSEGGLDEIHTAWPYRSSKPSTAL
jgi:hypothetical protein